MLHQLKKTEDFLREKIIQIIKSDLADELRGKDGEPYKLSNEDFERIIRVVLSRIKPSVVEKVIEKTEIIREKPTVTNEIKEVAVKDSHEEIIKKINEGVLQIDKSRIKGLEEKESKESSPNRKGALFGVDIIQTLTVRNAVTYTNEGTTPFNSFNFWQNITLSTGNYIRNITLSGGSNGDMVQFLVDMEAGSQTLKVYNQQVGGTQLFSYLSDPTNPSKGFIAFIRTNNAWVAYSANIMSVY